MNVLDLIYDWLQDKGIPLEEDRRFASLTKKYSLEYLRRNNNDPVIILNLSYGCYISFQIWRDPILLRVALHKAVPWKRHTAAGLLIPDEIHCTN